MSKEALRSGMCAAMLMLGIVPISGQAFEIEKKSPAKVEVVGVVVVVTLPTGTYSISQIPDFAAELKFSDELDPKLRAKNPAISAGEQISEEEVASVLEAWYRDSAFDIDRLKLRELKVGKPQYATWCSSPGLFRCAVQEIRAGVVVVYEVNGANREGGMTGYQAKAVMIRRSPK